MSEKIKILHLTDSPFTNTGYSSQSLYLMNGLADRNFDIHIMAHNYVGQKLTPNSVTLADGTPFKFSLSGGYREQYCADLWKTRLMEDKPDYFMVLLDTFMLFPKYIQTDFAPAKTVFWFPSDGGGGLPVNCDAILKKCYLPVAMSKFGQKQAKEVHGIDTGYIPHAVDEKNFHPLCEADRQLLKQKWNLQGKFVVGVVGRNQGRKMMDRIFKAFAIFAKHAPDAILLFHSDPNDGAAAFNMNTLISRYNLQNRVLYTGVTYTNGFTYEKMNEVYNVADIHFSSTSGEGFGVCTIESMAAGVPVVISDYTTSRELVIDDIQCGEVVKLSAEITGSWDVERGIMDIVDAAKKLLKLYKSPRLRKKYGKAGREKVLKNYTWEIVINAWEKLLREKL